MEPIDTAAIRDDIRRNASYGYSSQVLELCDEVDRLREALEASRTLHANLLAHLRESS